MTYDDWKLESPEDEYARRHPRQRRGVYQDDYDTTSVDGPPERDPDEAREDRMDREYDR